MSQRVYSVADIEKLCFDLSRHGWEVHHIEEGVLGCGHIILVAPEGYYHVEIKEVYLNCWSSGHIIRRHAKLSRRMRKLIGEGE